jgi:nucleoside-diphosphate-sugar epimerase
MRRVLVAGGTGALGAGVLAALLEASHPVTCTWLVDGERKRVEQEFADADGLSLVQADLMTAEGAEEAVRAAPELGAVVNLVGGFFPASTS